jgi:hypothetical protein
MWYSLLLTTSQKEKPQMPKGRTPQDIIDNLFWLNSLPETPWSRGILDTAADLKREIAELEEERKKVVEDIDGKIKNRMRVMRALPGRAEREASLIYPDGDVEAARTKVDAAE